MYIPHRGAKRFYLLLSAVSYLTFFFGYGRVQVSADLMHVHNNFDTESLATFCALSQPVYKVCPYPGGLKTGEY